MSGMDRLTDEQWLIQHLEDDAEACSAVNGSKDITTKDARRAEVTVKRLIRERDDARRASQAAPKGCGHPCGYDCNGACFKAAPAPSDELAQIDAMLMEGQGDDDGPQILPDFEPGWSVAAKVEACLHLLEKRRDVIAASAPSDGLREAVRAALEAELSFGAYDCTRVWEAWSVGTMTQDDFVPVSERLDEITDAIVAALTPAPAQEGEPRHD